jgi:ribosome-binding protein aMBF1 (putative translation factor)
MGRGKSISKYIKERRKENGLSQKELADRLDSHQPIISSWEKGNAKPDKKTISKIEKILGPIDEQVSDSVDNSDFSVWLRTNRIKKNYSIQELADRGKIPYITIHKIESGHISNPRDKTKRKIEKALRIKYSDFSEKEPDEIKTKGIGEFQEFNPYDFDDRPSDPGVYVFYDISERPIYVGEGQNIGKRINDHSDKFWFKKPIVETAAYIVVGDKELRQSIETILIKFLKSNAVINKQKVDR